MYTERELNCKATVIGGPIQGVFFVLYWCVKQQIPELMDNKIISTSLNPNLIPFKPGTSGNPNGRPVGAKNKQKITVILQDWFTEAVELIKDEQHENPLTILSCIANDPSNSANIRMKAAAELAGYLVPTLPKEVNLTVDHNVPNRTEIENQLLAITIEMQKRNLITQQVAPVIEAEFQQIEPHFDDNIQVHQQEDNK